jgi:proteasome activator subunit 4
MSEIEITDPSADFTQRYLQSFREDLPADETKAVLQDQSQSGWLAWGKTMEVTRLTGWEEIAWEIDETCAEGLAIFREAISSPEWWQTASNSRASRRITDRQVADHWAQEDTRTYPSATHIDLILSLAQLFGIQIFEATRPIIEGYLAEMEEKKIYDRHKMRALWEFLAGVLRGSEEWPGKDRKAFWKWLEGKLPELFGNIRHDTTK